MNEVVAAYPQRELHVIVDNLNIHKPKRDRWLRQHPQVHLHFTPTHASWLNQVEVWFSLLARQALRGASFTSVQQLREAIDALHRRATTRRPSPLSGRSAKCGRLNLGINTLT